MNAFHRSFAFVCILACLAAQGSAAESKESLDDVLAKWEAATAKIKTLDAKVCRWKYDFVFSSPNETQREEGRFYYAGPKCGCLQIKSKDGSGWNGLVEMYVWREKETWIINGGSKTCQKYVLPSDKPGVPYTENSFVNLFKRVIGSPTNVLPFTVEVNKSECRNDYTLTLKEQGDHLLIIAQPKSAFVRACTSEIEVLVDPKTYLTTSIRCHAPNGKDYTDWKFEDVKINQRPRDLGQLLSPDLHGLTVHELK